MNKFKIYSFIVGLVVLGACTYEFPEQAPPTSGTADFSKIVSVGNSLTAGYAGGSLYTAAQNLSYPSIFAAQVASVGGGSTFNQPDINSVNGYNSTYSNPSQGIIFGQLIFVERGGVLGIEPTGPLTNLPAPFNTADAPSAYTGDKAALNNFAVPGVTVGLALTPLTGTPGDPYENPYYTRFASVPGTSTIIGDAAAAMANGGTFFIFWLGNNDVLGYATGGGSNPAILTDPTVFAGQYNAAISAMLDANSEAKGVVANIPNIVDIPYFTYVGYALIPMDAPTAGYVNSQYADYNNGLETMVTLAQITQAEADRRKIEFVASPANPFVMEDESLKDLSAFGLPSIRQSEPTDLVLLSASSVVGKDQGSGVIGVAAPVGDAYVLIPDEQEDVSSSITAFNATIASAVSSSSGRLALVDMNSIFANFAQNGALINGSGMDASFIPPFGAFSPDGVHPNSRGYGYVANQFIEVVNASFGSTIPYCNPNDYAGNQLPLPLP